MRFLTYLDWWRRWRALPVASWISAAKMYNQGRLAEAEKLYLDGIHKAPQHPARIAVELDLAHCLFKSRKLKEAELRLKDAIILSPDCRELYLRLIRLKLWTGHADEACWLVKKAISILNLDDELAYLYATAAIESANDRLVHQARNLVTAQLSHGSNDLRLLACDARLDLRIGNRLLAVGALVELATMDCGPFEAVVAYGEHLLLEGRLSEARHHLLRAAKVSPDHPKVLTALARSYLLPGESSQPQFAQELAQKACQSSGWMSPEAMHCLADAYLKCDKLAAAQLVVSKAVGEGERVFGRYSQQDKLLKLKDSLENLASEPHDGAQ